MKTTKICLGIILISAVFIFSCNQTGTSESSPKEETKKEKELKDIPAVNVYNYSKRGLQVIEDVKNDKSHLTFIQLGEKVVLTGEKDSLNDREYYKVKLSDGNIGWSMGKYLIENAIPATIIEETPIYERPNVINKTSKTFNNIEIVAITDENEEWYQVVGINTLKKGWIRKGVVSKEEQEIAMAVLAIKNVYDQKLNLLVDKVHEFLESAPYPQSTVASALRLELEEKQIKASEFQATEETIDSEE